MPRARKNVLFELAGQWIARDPSSPNYYRFWTDAGTRRTRRASLGTTDFETAKTIFAHAVLTHGPKTPDSPLANVLEAYFVGRTDSLPSKKHARLAGKTLLQCWGNTIRCSQVTDAQQRSFAEWSIQRGHALSYISRNLSVLAAAMKRAKLPVEIIFGKRQIVERWSLQTKAPRRVFIPSDDELARYLSSGLPDPFLRWAILSCLTGARPEAALDIGPDSRNRDAGLLDLNPAGRSQNKKFRPTVREPKALKAWLDKWKSSHLVGPDGETVERYAAYWSVESGQTAIERARLKTGIPISAYSFRHKVATVLRKARIPEDQIALQLGHRRSETGITASYGEWSPDYLAPAAKALDAWWQSLAKKASVRLLAGTIRKSRSVERPKLRLASRARIDYSVIADMGADRNPVMIANGLPQDVADHIVELHNKWI